MEKKRKKRGLNKQSQEQINKRREIGKRVLAEYGYSMNKRQFIEEYSSEMRDQLGIEPPTDRRTFDNDIISIQNDLQDENIYVTFTVDYTEPDVQYKIFRELSKKISDKIRYVIINVADKDYIVYNASSSSKPSLKKFNKKVSEIYALKKDSTSTIHNDSLVNAYIIFYEKGYEMLTCDFFKENITTHKILFTSQHSYCSQIVSLVRYLPSLMEKLFLTIYG